MTGNSNSTKNSGREDSISKEAFVVKPSSIRIWIHDKDVAKLTRVLWAGQGNRLRTEISTSPKVKKFLETVPYALNVIKEVHQAVVDNNLDELKSKTEPPVPPGLITTKDLNGLTVMHKAAGLAHTRIVEYLLKIWPNGATDLDSTGKTPLHWAASAKNNTRCYNLLVQAGADEEALDYRMKVASYYKHKPNDIDRSFLTVVPDAPRVAQESHPDWSSLVDDMGKQMSSDLSPSNNNAISKDDSMFGNGVNLLTTRAKANSIEDTSEPDDMDDGKDKLSIGEQAVMAAIEDERLYEQLQQEKEKSLQLNGNEDYDDDMNENDIELEAMVTPPLTSNLEDNDENGNDQSEDGLNANPHIGKQENGEDDDNEEQGESIDGEDKQQQEEHQQDMDMGVNDEEERGEGDEDKQNNRIEADENEDENVDEKQPESEVAVETDNKSENEEDNQGESITANREVDESNNEIDKANNEVDEANKEVDEANKEVDEANNEIDEATNEVDETNKEVDEANNEVDEANEDVEKPTNENEPDQMETTDNESEEKTETPNGIDENGDKSIEKTKEEKIKLNDDDSSNEVSSKNDGENSTKLENNDDKKLDEDDDDQVHYGTL